jgi:hypothetical protein
MKKLLLAALLALPLLALPTRAHAWGGFSLTVPGCPWKIEAGANAYFRCSDGNPSAQAGPWYLYWPLEAHFGPPAPTGYPFWPSHMTLPPNGHGHAAPGPLPPMPARTPTVQPSGFRPVSYTTPAPGYWHAK